MIDIDISALYKKMGINPAEIIVYKPKREEQRQLPLIFNVPGIEITQDNMTNYLGMPVLFPITFKGGTYEIYNNGELDEIKLDDFILPASTIATFRASKDAVITKINGSNSRVIEIWSDLLWDIRIKGFTLPEEVPSEETIRNLVLYSRIKDVEVSGDIFEWLDISRLFIKSLDIQQNQGYGDMLTFSLSCINVEPIELTI